MRLKVRSRSATETPVATTVSVYDLVSASGIHVPSSCLTCTTRYALVAQGSQVNSTPSTILGRFAPPSPSFGITYFASRLFFTFAKKSGAEKLGKLAQKS